MTQLPRLALSVRQPWAWAILYAGKDIENRSWRFGKPARRQRGRIAIHASLGMTKAEYAEAATFMASIGVICPPPADLVRGAVIGSVEVIDVVKDSISPWYMGTKCALVLHNPEPWLVPVPAVGQLGFFEWRPTEGGKVAEPAKWMLAPALDPQQELLPPEPWVCRNQTGAEPCDCRECQSLMFIKRGRS